MTNQDTDVMRFNAYKRDRYHHWLNRMTAQIQRGSAEYARFCYEMALTVRSTYEMPRVPQAWQSSAGIGALIGDTKGY